MLDLQAEFPQDPETCYLNHAAVAPWPARSAEAARRFADQCVRVGARHYPDWLREEQRLRQQLAQLIHAEHPLDVALLKNTSEGLSFIAAGLDWREGDNVIISNQEFPSNRIPWEALARHGVTVSEVDLDVDDPEQALIDAMVPRTRLLSVSSIQYGTGLRLDLPRLGHACRQHGVLFCVDAIQSLGAVQFDVQACQADFVVADGHKWMLGPEGLALFWVRPALREQLSLTEYGWHMVAEAGNYDRHDWQPAADARRFECGSPNLLCAHVLSASLSLLLETGMDTVERELLARTSWLHEKLSQLGKVSVISPADSARRGGIVTFRPTGETSQALHRRLMDQGIICAARGGGVRFSPHFYTPYEVMEKAMAAL